VENYTDILRGHERSGCRLETIRFLAILTKDGSRRRGMCFVCLKHKDRKNAVNSVSVQNVCARTALTRQFK
jgi:hypothetical protein